MNKLMTVEHLKKCGWTEVAGEWQNRAPGLGCWGWWSFERACEMQAEIEACI